MDSIRIETKELRIQVNDDPNRVIAFNPNDIGFAKRFFDLIDACDRKQRDFLAEEKRLLAENAGKPVIERNRLTNELEMQMFEFILGQIDTVFGPGTSQAAFDGARDLDLVVQLFDALTPYVERARRAQVEKYTKRADGGVL